MVEFELVLPCYNESKSLPAILDRAIRCATEAGYSPATFQLVLVENGSKDDSSAVMDRLKDSPQGVWFRKILVRENRGYGFGLQSGLQSTAAPIVGWSHADQQCDPRDAFTALAAVKSAGGRELLVKGVRSGRDRKDRIVSRVFDAFARVILGAPFYEINAQPKVFPRALLANLQEPPLNFAFDLYVLYHAYKAGYRIHSIPVHFPPRVHGVSNWAHHFASRYRTILGMIRYMWRLSRAEGRV